MPLAAAMSKGWSERRGLRGWIWTLGSALSIHALSTIVTWVTSLGLTLGKVCITRSPIHTAVCMRVSCANSLHPPPCESFRCVEDRNADPPLGVVSGPHYWWTTPVWMDKPEARSGGVSVWLGVTGCAQAHPDWQIAHPVRFMKKKKKIKIGRYFFFHIICFKSFIVVFIFLNIWNVIYTKNKNKLHLESDWPVSVNSPAFRKWVTGEDTAVGQMLNRLNCYLWATFSKNHHPRRQVMLAFVLMNQLRPTDRHWRWYLLSKSGHLWIYHRWRNQPLNPSF